MQTRKTNNIAAAEAVASETIEVEILEIEDDLDTGMHRVNVCKAF